MDGSIEDSPALVDAKHPDPTARMAWWPWLVPIIVAVLIVVASPNYRLAPPQSDGQPAVRQTPLGADFVQEYVGGSIYASDQRERLYEFDHFNAREHDPELTGFRWPEEDYFPMVYPPFYYAAMSSWSWLDYRAAMVAWAVLIGIAVSMSGWLLSRLYPPCRNNIGLLMVGSILFVPIISNLTMGQKGNFLLLILAATFGLLYQKRSLAAGAVFGLIAFKPHLGLVIGLAMLVQRRWWFVAGSLATVGVLVGSSWWLTPQLWSDYLGVVGGMSDYVQTGGYQLQDSHSLWGAMQLTFGGLGPTTVKTITIVLSLILIGVLGWAIMRPEPLTSPKFAWQFSAMVLATIVLSPHFHGYDLAILGVPIIVFTSTAAQLPNQYRKPILYLMLGIVALAGLFPQLATISRFQASVLLLSVWLVLIGCSVNDKLKR